MVNVGRGVRGGDGTVATTSGALGHGGVLRNFGSRGLTFVVATFRGAGNDGGGGGLLFNLSFSGGLGFSGLNFGFRGGERLHALFTVADVDNDAVFGGFSGLGLFLKALVVGAGNSHGNGTFRLGDGFNGNLRSLSGQGALGGVHGFDTFDGLGDGRVGGGDLGASVVFAVFDPLGDVVSLGFGKSLGNFRGDTLLVFARGDGGGGGDDVFDNDGRVGFRSSRDSSGGGNGNEGGKSESLEHC